MRAATWRPGDKSIAEIEKIQPAGNCYENHVEEANQIGIREGDAVFTLGSIPILDLAYWVGDAEAAELLEVQGSDFRGLVGAWTSASPPPPIIAVRYSDGTAWGLDGYHRLNAARLAGLDRLPAWLAIEQSD